MSSQIIPLTVTASFNGVESTVYPALLIDDANIILVDCGFAGSLPRLTRALEEHGLSPERLTGLVLTHHDHDHIGTAAELRRLNPRLTVYASQAEAPYISGREKSLRLRQAEALQETLPPEEQDFGRAFCDMLRRVEPAPVDVFLSDGDYMDWCGGCRVIATPGHTPGHIALYFEKESLVITGDAIVPENGAPAIANPQFTLDMEQAVSSMRRLLNLGAKSFLCYHGGVFSRGQS